ncbi:branched-chain amino acid permease [Cereibacter changlensis JA139]|uniref:Branched-chain amino acid permease n=2 Tax=Cereibacter changlensis TaxID=402884 RepID=A0A2T4JP64_9RHOB|nr:AzlC family ABC transporter permease [Cereibacter changlensis]PTE19567.1 branched-chain amino acid permease [Cereibacter changlensis JA139]PZX48632.1 4-azaleucine resistance transporter AzlC [Cereibacter changlensis]
MSEQTATYHIAPEDGFQAGVIACLPTVLGYWSIGFAAGGIGTLSGFSVTEVALLAALLYAGSAQFLFYSLALANVGILAIVLGVLLVNARYLLMSSYLSRFFQNKRWGEKFLGGALLTDETFGVAAQRAKASGELPFRWLLGLNLTAYVNWIVANLAGAMLAHYLPEGMIDSLSFSLTAMFVGLLLLTYLASDTRSLELVAIAVAAGMVAILFHAAPANIVLLAATVVGALASALLSLRNLHRNRQWLRPSS